VSKRKKQAYACVIVVVGIVLVHELVIGAGGSGPTVVLGAPTTASRRERSTAADRTSEAKNASAWVLMPERFPPQLPEDGVIERDVLGLSSVAREALLQEPEESNTAGEPANHAELAERDAKVFLLEPFKERHTVSAVASSGAFTMAIVDGVWMGVGQSLDGCVLTRISGETAVFDCFGEHVELSVETVRLSDEN